MIEIDQNNWPAEVSAKANTPQAQALLRRANEYCAQDQFVREGTMVAMPMGFPHVGEPIARGENAITALATAPNHVVYGLTSGRRTHVFCAMLHAATGFVHDLGIIEEATEGVAIGLGADGLVYALVNSAQQGWVVRLPQATVPYDSLQEWVLAREPIELSITPPQALPFATGLIDRAGRAAYAVLNDGRLLRMDLSDGSTREIAQTADFERTGRALAEDDRGVIYGTGFLGRIWQYDPTTDTFEQWAESIACGAGRASYNRASSLAFDPVRRVLYAASEADGTLSAIDLQPRRVRSLGQVDSMQPVYALTTTTDGRVYGITGDADNTGRMFVYDPAGPQLRELGLCASVLGARVYGFTFRSATQWRDGAMIFGEADAVSHVWVYFPALATANCVAGSSA